ncbi:hypothetical protein CAPTEDRAFT_205388 [Capitella teleta]|uniref:Endonuclease/exonuclease/phosphatase domain-containing protein n=1 Tax=Capitella teleta TaxID=283909 RepID=R7TML9_CAPTE|nr:hypothetical protein CAPTEDRAFT_205388 [Capitella teleta]|eukprot:ELT94884.1 hypothetical protein CAPTEDRAFT_205388 [Capitella teleta]
MAKVDECKKSDSDSFPIRVRPGRISEQPALPSKVYKLNQQAKPGTSFSLRNNAEVWMYRKSYDCKWLRVTDWMFSDSEQGNGDQTPNPQTEQKTSAQAIHKCSHETHAKLDCLMLDLFTFVGQHRPKEKGTRGGGVGFVLKSGLMTKTVVHNYNTFEALTLILTSNNRATITVVYHPPPSSENGFSTTDFLREIELLLSELHLDYTSMCVVGDFNVHVDKCHDPTYAAFEQTLQGLSFHQLKLILETSERPFLSRRALKLIHMADFMHDVSEALSSLDFNAPTLDESLIAMNTVLLTTLDFHALLKKVCFKGDVHKRWYDDEIHKEGQKRQRFDRNFKKTELQVHLISSLRCGKTSALKWLDSSTRKRKFNSRIN